MLRVETGKLVFRFLILATLLVSLALLSIGRPGGLRESGVTQQPHGQQRFLHVQVDQLPGPWGNLVPLRCEDVTLVNSREIKTVSCVLKNNTAKYIEAGTLSISVVLDKNGPITSPAGLLSFDTFLHPDFREEHPNNLIAPGAEYLLRDASSIFEDPVRSITASLDYVQFSDGTTAGPNYRGSQIINAQREGARKYKNWLAAKYRETSSLETVVRQLAQDGNFAPELGIVGSDEEQGAKIFRKLERRLYETKGAEALGKHFRSAHQ